MQPQAGESILQSRISALNRFVTLRLTPGQEIMECLNHFIKTNRIHSCFIATCVGSVTQATLRLAHDEKLQSNKIVNLKDHFEIVSLVGTLSCNCEEEFQNHLHISLSDKDGSVIGGHVIGDLRVFTTAEIVLGLLEDVRYKREFDERTGFPELCFD